MSRTSGSRWFRAKRATSLVALLTATAFLNLEVAQLLRGHFEFPAARAAESRRIAAFLFPDKDEDRSGTAVLVSIIRNRCLAEMDGVVLVDPVERGAAALFEQGKQAVEEGVAALDAKDWARARPRFEKALQVFDQATGQVDARSYARALKGLGVALFNLGSKAEAQDYVIRSLLIVPQQNADQFAYNLETKGLFRTARAAMQDTPTGNLDIKTVPDGAEIHLDFNLRGHSPLTLSNLTAGKHHLRIVRDGFKVFEQFVDIRPGANEQMSPALVATPNRAALEAAIGEVDKALRKDRKVAEAAMQLKRVVGAQEILVAQAGVQRGAFRVHGAYYAEDGSPTDIDESIPRDATLFENLRAFSENTFAGAYRDVPAVVLDSPGGDVGAVEVGMGDSGAGTGDSDLVIDPNSPLFGDTGRAKKDPVYKKWWFWTIIGVAAAGTATGLGFLLAGGGEGEKPGGTIRVNLSNFGQ